VDKRFEYNIKDKELFLESLYQLHKSLGMVGCTPYEILEQVWLGDENTQKTILRKDLIQSSPVHVLFTQPRLWEEVVGYVESKLGTKCDVQNN
jgi:hypothetical protein